MNVKKSNEKNSGFFELFWELFSILTQISL